MSKNISNDWYKTTKYCIANQKVEVSYNLSNYNFQQPQLYAQVRKFIKIEARHILIFLIEDNISSQQ